MILDMAAGLQIQDEAWPRTRSFLRALGLEPRCIRDLFDIPQDLMELAWAAVWLDLRASGIGEAYEIARAEGDALDPRPFPVLDSDAVLVYAFPACLKLALERLAVQIGPNGPDASALADRTRVPRWVPSNEYGYPTWLPTASATTPWEVFGETATDLMDAACDRYPALLPWPDTEPYVRASLQAFRQVAEEPYIFDQALAHAAIERLRGELSWVGLKFEDTNDVYGLLLGYTQEGPRDLHTPLRVCEFFELGGHAELYRRAISVELVEPPTDWEVAWLILQRAVREGNVGLAETLAALLRDGERFDPNVANLAVLALARLAGALGEFQQSDAWMDAYTPSSDRWEQVASYSSEVQSYLEGARDAYARVGQHPSGLDDSLRRIERMIASQTKMMVGIGERVSTAAAGLARIDDQLLGMLTLQLSTRELLQERDWDRAARNLLDDWTEVATQAHGNEQEAACVELVGPPAWNVLAPQSKRDLRVYHLLRGGSADQVARFQGFALLVTFERELRAKLSELSVPGPELRVDFGRLLSRAAAGNGKVAGIARQAERDGLVRLRNSAAHPDSFGAVELGRVEDILLRKGMNGIGLLPLLAMADG